MSICEKFWVLELPADWHLVNFIGLLLRSCDLRVALALIFRPMICFAPVCTYVFWGNWLLTPFSPTMAFMQGFRQLESIGTFSAWTWKARASAVSVSSPASCSLSGLLRFLFFFNNITNSSGWISWGLTLLWINLTFRPAYYWCSELYKNNIEGTIPAELGNLKSLISLDLYNNNISGIIPSSLGKLKSLVFLWVCYASVMHNCLYECHPVSDATNG